MARMSPTALSRVPTWPGAQSLCHLLPAPLLASAAWCPRCAEPLPAWLWLPWRAEYPPGEMWQQVAAGEQQPCKQTCWEPSAMDTQGDCSKRQAPGCVCRHGHFRSQAGSCVPTDHCECRHHGRPHPPGSEWQEARESCRCLGGKSVCAQHCPHLTCAQGPTCSPAALPECLQGSSLGPSSEASLRASAGRPGLLGPSS